ncbi:TetR/AcrR family transcriptional regulator [Erythrobacter neustonensis]|uniref:TetR family transcriptional regulator n=1 Tax=Erythrobacter neustonensis TaxID=1112 RepID=A0A192D7B9_9SPHN|nr:TetR/AcrR family transcriptional regulator [Erythrobacter neustonensis]ANK13921.1 TetR family transcriptional regulator [Erythrobacter neustonensis]
MAEIKDAQSGLRERKKDKTRTALLEAALRLFEQQGFAETTISQIAAEVDVSPRTLLRYFATKEDIVVSQVEDSTAVFLDSFAARSSNTHLASALLSSARALIAHYEAHAPFYLAIERAIAASPDIRARKLAMTAGLADQLAVMIGAKGVGQQPVDWQVRLYTDIVFALIRNVIARWVDADGKPSLTAMFDEAAALTGIA